MEMLLQQVQGHTWGYSWISTPAVEAVVCLLAAAILRPAGKLKQALAYLARAQQGIHAELQQHNLGIEVC